MSNKKRNKDNVINEEKETTQMIDKLQRRRDELEYLNLCRTDPGLKPIYDFVVIRDDEQNKQIDKCLHEKEKVWKNKIEEDLRFLGEDRMEE